MVFDKLPTDYHDVQILTVHFQFSGQLEVIGVPFAFINDAARHSFSIHDAHLTPLTPGSPMKGFSRPQVVVRRPQIAFFHFDNPATRAEIRLLPRSELLVIYTPIAVCRGQLHMSSEARLGDFLDVLQGYFVPATQVRIFPLLELPAPFPLEADLILLGRDQIMSYHPA